MPCHIPIDSWLMLEATGQLDLREGGRELGSGGNFCWSNISVTDPHS